MSRHTRIIGLVFLISALPLTLRMAWEMTWLTWHDGPQMVGFSLAHVFPAFLVFGSAAMLGLAVWAIVAIIICLRRRTIRWTDLLMIGISLMICGTTFIPQQVWSSATELVLGVSPQASNLLVDAASHGQLTRVRYLLDQGVSPDAWNDEGCAALAAAAGSKNPETVRLLLDHHANPNCSCGGSPALSHAIEKNDLTSFKLLLTAGANIEARDKQGFNAYDEALFSQNKELVQYLESRGITR